MAEARPEVLWFGTPPAAETVREFRHRNLSIRCCTTTAPVESTNACAAVFRFGVNLPEDVLRAANTTQGRWSTTD
jgi:hypothetical protein